MMWFVLSYDMIAAVVGFVVFISHIFDCDAINYADCQVTLALTLAITRFDCNYADCQEENGISYK